MSVPGNVWSEWPIKVYIRIYDPDPDTVYFGFMDLYIGSPDNINLLTNRHSGPVDACICPQKN